MKMLTTACAAPAKYEATLPFFVVPYYSRRRRMFEKACVYLAPPDRTFRPVLWFRARTNNQLLWAPFGLTTKQALLRAEWPEQFVAANDESERRYPLRGYAERNIRVDHFNWHQDGVVLLKDANTTPIYHHKMRHLKPLGPESPLFLQIGIQTEVAAQYRSVTEHLESDAVVVRTELGSGIGAHFSVAGANFPMADYLAETSHSAWTIGPVFVLGPFVAGVTYYPTKPNATLSEDRLRGTFLSLRFLLQSGVYRHKTFLFE
jgi:hypothetical protein